MSKRNLLVNAKIGKRKRKKYFCVKGLSLYVVTRLYHNIIKVKAFLCYFVMWYALGKYPPFESRRTISILNNSCIGGTYN